MLWTLLLMVLGFVFFGIVGAFMGAVLGIGCVIVCEVRRGNDTRRKLERETVQLPLVNKQAVELLGNLGPKAGDFVLAKIDEAVVQGNEAQLRHWHVVMAALTRLAPPPSPFDAAFDWLDAKTGGRLSGKQRDLP